MDDPPPPYSSTPDTRQTQLQPVSRWHPKMSPYRIIVIVTTVVLGTLKALFVYRGVSIVSTTLEWIAGVVFTLLMFVLDELEAKESYPKYLHWFFTFDCADVMWRALDILSIPRPRYRSDEFKERLRNSTFVSMTGYRILVSTMVVVLGLGKAVLAYLGQNPTANYLDWILAVVITSLLYYIGLYESNSVNLAPDFFVRDHYNIFFIILRDILIILGLGLSLWGGLAALNASLSGFKANIYLFMASVTTESQSFMLVQSLGIFMLCVWAAIVTIALIGVVGVVALIVWALQQEPEFFRFLFRRGKIAKYYDLVTDKALSITALALPMLRRARRLTYSTLRFGAHLFGIFTLISLFLVIIFLMKLFGEGFDLNGGLGKLAGTITIQLFFGAYVGVVLWGIYYLTRSLISPLFLPARTTVFA